MLRKVSRTGLIVLNASEGCESVRKKCVSTALNMAAIASTWANVANVANAVYSRGNVRTDAIIGDNDDTIRLTRRWRDTARNRYLQIQKVSVGDYFYRHKRHRPSEVQQVARNKRR